MCLCVIGSKQTAVSSAHKSHCTYAEKNKVRMDLAEQRIALNLRIYFSQSHAVFAFSSSRWQSKTVNLITIHAKVHFKNKQSGVYEFKFRCFKKKNSENKENLQFILLFLYEA